MGVAFAPLRFSGGIAASLPSIRSNFAGSRTTIGFMSTIVAILVWLGDLLLVVNIVMLAIRTTTKRYNVQTAALLLLSSKFWGSVLWLWCLIVAYTDWGIRPVILGLVLGGVGIVPVTAIGLFADHYWIPFGELVFQALLTFGAYLLGSKMARE